MTHPTATQMLEYLDGTILNGQRTEVARHLESCAMCRNKVEFQRALSDAARHQPLIRPSKNFAESVMQALLQHSRPSWDLPILNNLGGAFAMMIVLGVLGYLLSVQSAAPVASQQSPVGQFLKGFSDLYAKTNQFMMKETVEAHQKFGAVTSTTVVRILLFTAISFLVLAGIDRFVFRQFLKTRFR